MKVLKGIVSLLNIMLTTLLFSVFMYIIILLKVVVPNASFKKKCTHWLEVCSQGWIQLNLSLFSLLHTTKWEITGVDTFSLNKSYFVICNHQSFVDVFALQKIFIGKTPPFKYFMKQSLIWMPLIGLVWWALDCIFMKRYPKAVLEKNPHLREVDMKTTQKKCRLFKGRPITLVNFVEGTRLTSKKHAHQQSTYQKLLKPRAGGLAYMMSAMEGQIRELIDVTINYPSNNNRFWDFLCDRIPRIHVHIEVIPIPDRLLEGDYITDPHYREHIQSWLTTLWQQKDQRLIEMEKTNP